MEIKKTVDALLKSKELLDLNQALHKLHASLEDAALKTEIKRVFRGLEYCLKHASFEVVLQATQILTELLQPDQDASIELYFAGLLPLLVHNLGD